MIRVILFDRRDQPIGELSEAEVFALNRYEKVNGEHSLTITTTRVLEQGWRVLTCDARGKWREHVVYGTDALHSSGERPFGDYYCVWSLQADLMGTRVSRMPGVQTPVAAAVALGYAIEGTARWQVGTVTNTATGGGSMYDTDGWSAMGVLVANWGGEIDVTIEVGSTGITARKVDYYSKQGDQTPKRRYDFGADIKSVRRRVADGPLYCRITPRGMGEETGDGYGRKITIESVNNGKDYLENADMVELAKLPNGSGGWEYPTLEVENSNCETPAALKTWAEGILEERTTPQITYEVDVLQLAREGIDMHGVSLGDAIHIVDRKFGNGLRVSGRVLEMTVNLLNTFDMQITVGSIASDLASMLGSFDTRLSEVTNTVQAMNGGTMSTAEYLSRLLDRLNAEINGEGGYTYITQGQGIRCYNKAVADPTDGTDADSVVEIKGGTIRIANSKTAQGAWDWKTVFTSGHIAANLITAANLIAGSIGSADGGTYWNLDNDYLKLGPTALLDETTVEDFLEALDATVTSVAVQYRYSDSATAITGDYTWQDSCPAWVNGKYIWTRTTTTTTAGTTVTNTTCISGAAGPAGQGVTVSSIEYGTSTSATTQPASWSETAPTVTQGQWLWVRTTYSDNSTTTAKSYAGTDGQDGNSVYVASSTKSGGTTTVVLSDGTTTTTLTIDDGDDGDDGTPGANGYTHIAWATSADGSQGFSTSVSTGKTYVGFYADNTQADSQRHQDYSWSLIKGADGQDGDDGVGINSVTVTYGTSASASTQPSSWQNSIPTVAEGQYLWTKTVTDYTDPNMADTVTYTYAKQGAKGDTGSAGSSVTVSSIKYQIGASASTAPTGTWQNDPYDTTAAKPYLWTKTTFSDSTVAYGVAKRGADGQDGDDGVGISSVVPQYYLSTSNTTQVNGSWSATEPVWQEGKYIWTRSLITWADNTTATTTPVLANGLNSANENAAKANALIRPYSDGVLVCRSGNSVGAFVNADGSFDIVNVTWANGVPTAGSALATFGSTIYIGNGTHGIEITSTSIAMELESEQAFVVSYTPATTSGGYNWYMQMDFMVGMLRCKASGYNQPRQLSTEGYPLLFKDGDTIKYWNGTSYAAQSMTELTVGNRSSGTVGYYTLSVGESNVVSGRDSTAFGQGLIAQDTVQTALGIANVAKDGPLLIVGNGEMEGGVYRSNVFEVNYNGGAWLSGTLTQTSDKRLKEHLEYLGEDAVEFIRKLQPALYVKDGTKQLGFYAQDVQDADEWETSMVTSNHVNDRLDFDPLSLEYTSLIAPLTAYAQALEARVAQLEQRLAAQ